MSNNNNNTSDDEEYDDDDDGDEEDETEDQLEERAAASNTLDKYKIMTINFSDKETRNRFMHYHKAAFKFNDAKACEQWKLYNEKILAKLKAAAAAAAGTSRENETDEIGGDECGGEATKRHKRTLSSTSMSTSSESTLAESSSSVSSYVKVSEEQAAFMRYSREKKELNSFILTNFSTQDELDTLKRLFYGPYFAEASSATKEVAAKEEATAKSRVKTAVSTASDQEQLRSLNADFIRRHQSKQAAMPNKLG